MDGSVVHARGILGRLIEVDPEESLLSMLLRESEEAMDDMVE